MKTKFNWNHLITEDSKNISLGRISFWIVFIILLAYWIYDIKMLSECQQPVDVPESLLYCFMTLLIYNISKKITKVIGTRGKFFVENDDEEGED